MSQNPKSEPIACESVAATSTATTAPARMPATGTAAGAPAAYAAALSAGAGVVPAAVPCAAMRVGASPLARPPRRAARRALGDPGRDAALPSSAESLDRAPWRRGASDAEATVRGAASPSLVSRAHCTVVAAICGSAPSTGSEGAGGRPWHPSPPSAARTPHLPVASDVRRALASIGRDAMEAGRESASVPSSSSDSPNASRDAVPDARRSLAARPIAAARRPLSSDRAASPSSCAMPALTASVRPSNATEEASATSRATAPPPAFPCRALTSPPSESSPSCGAASAPARSASC